MPLDCPGQCPAGPAGAAPFAPAGSGCRTPALTQELSAHLLYSCLQALTLAGTQCLAGSSPWLLLQRIVQGGLQVLDFFWSYQVGLVEGFLPVVQLLFQVALLPAEQVLFLLQVHHLLGEGCFCSLYLLQPLYSFLVTEQLESAAVVLGEGSYLEVKGWRPPLSLFEL